MSDPTDFSLTPFARRVADAFREWAPGPVPLVAADVDADGLSSAALLLRLWERLEGERPEHRLVGRGDNAWTDAFASEIARRAPARLVVADLGTAGRRVTEAPTAVIDHHVPTGTPEGALVLSGASETPVPTTSLIAHECVRGALGDAAAEEWEWLAAVGLLGDLGDKAPFDLLARAKKRYGAGKLRELVSLVNAPRRASDPNPEPPLRLLMQVASPREAVDGDSEERRFCQSARDEVKAATAHARKQPPRFGSVYGPTIAFVRLDSPCQVHPLIAQTWVGRLKADAVFAANFGFQPDQVNFSGRARSGFDLIEWLAKHRPEGADPTRYGNGHRKAAGGALSFEAWDRFMEGLGFGEEMRAGG